MKKKVMKRKNVNFVRFWSLIESVCYQFLISKSLKVETKVKSGFANQNMKFLGRKF